MYWSHPFSWSGCVGRTQFVFGGFLLAALGRVDFGWLWPLAAAVVLYLQLALVAKRLHHIELSAWWMAAPFAFAALLLSGAILIDPHGWIIGWTSKDLSLGYASKPGIHLGTGVMSFHVDSAPRWFSIQPLGAMRWIALAAEGSLPLFWLWLAIWPGKYFRNRYDAGRQALLRAQIQPA